MSYSIEKRKKDLVHDEYSNSENWIKFRKIKNYNSAKKIAIKLSKIHKGEWRILDIYTNKLKFKIITI